MKSQGTPDSLRSAIANGLMGGRKDLASLVPLTRQERAYQESLLIHLSDFLRNRFARTLLMAKSDEAELLIDDLLKHILGNEVREKKLRANHG